MRDATTTVTFELPTELYERFSESAAVTGTDEESLLVELVRDRVERTESIRTYTDRFADPAGDSRSRSSAEGRGGLPEVRPPIGQLLGFDLEDLDRGRSTVSFAAGPEHANPMGTLHGGVYCDIGDAAMGTAFASTLEDDESFTTLELDAAFLKPVWEADLVATAEVTKRGRTTGLVECTVTDDEGSLVAKLNSVCLVLRGEAARGR